MCGREIIMLKAQRRDHHAQRAEEKSSRSTRGREIITLNAWKIIITLNVWKIIIVPAARKRKDDMEG